ncbi:hypothetical protein QBZ16_000478 [Prototheca wickerhamii]|uniref:Ankyrin repeat domain-containing protein n=1 Tax=Prototheca wickerhamii TaxID=3111 RepID=A0AAD9MIT0_PROWI|nr:hypothetical protein QBZ16_000478 [Prototheca wickerhamii]
MTESRGAAMQGFQAAQRLFSLAVDASPEDFDKALGPLEKTDLTQVRDTKRRSLLHVAAASGNDKLLKHLGHLPTVDYLLAAGASANPKRPLTAGPLHRAAGAGQTEAVSRLVKAGADPSLDSGSGSALLWAAGAGHAGAVGALLQGGADPNDGGRDGMTPLFMAAAAGHAAGLSRRGAASADSAAGAQECVCLLIEAGADVGTSSNGFTALHVAAESGDAAMVEALVRAGAPTDARDPAGNTPAELAASWQRTEALDLLLRLARPDESAAERQKRAAALVATVEARDRERAAAAGGKAGARPAARARPPGWRSRRPRSRARSWPPASRPRAPTPLPTATSRPRSSSGVLRCATRRPTPPSGPTARPPSSKLDDHASALADARAARSLNPRYVKAWYREGLAAEALALWEDAALAYFEAYSLEPARTAFIDKFQHAIEQGRKAHKANAAA